MYTEVLRRTCVTDATVGGDVLNVGGDGVDDLLGGMHLAIANNAELSVPPEEAPHTRTFMMWPTSRQVYEDAIFLEMTQRTIADIANAISDSEPVTLLASSERHAGMRRIVSEQVELWDVPTKDL